MTTEDYIRMVAWELRDLPWKMRRDLVSEIRAQLDELPAGTDLFERLGRPHEYAAELRDAAGLDRRHGLVAYLRARRPRNLILIAVVLALVGMGIGAVEWIDTYQPLGFANWYKLPGGSVDSPAGNSASVVFHQGRQFELGLEVRNSGRFTVRVLGVPHMSGLNPFEARVFMYEPTYTGGYATRPEPFHPFDLKPRQADILLLKGVYANCRRWRGAGSTILTDFSVRYGFLWRRATAVIPLPEELAIVFKKQNDCR